MMQCLGTCGRKIPTHSMFQLWATIYRHRAQCLALDQPNEQTVPRQAPNRPNEGTRIWRCQRSGQSKGKEVLINRLSEERIMLSRRPLGEGEAWLLQGVKFKFVNSSYDDYCNLCLINIPQSLANGSGPSALQLSFERSEQTTCLPGTLDGCHCIFQGATLGKTVMGRTGLLLKCLSNQAQVKLKTA